tara:strand:+ start:177 stop:1319 length:1143 start_codon:yes stop_codon:yes gene_type:complete
MIKNITDMNHLELNKVLNLKGIDTSKMNRVDKLLKLKGLGINEYLLTNEKEHIMNKNVSIQTIHFKSSGSSQSYSSGKKVVKNEPFGYDVKFTDIEVKNNIIVDGSLNIGGKIINNTKLKITEDSSEVNTFIINFTEAVSVFEISTSNSIINLKSNTSSIDYYKTGEIFFNIQNVNGCLIKEHNSDSNIIISGLGDTGWTFPQGKWIATYVIVGSIIYINFMNKIYNINSGNTSNTLFKEFLGVPTSNPQNDSTLLYKTDGTFEFTDTTSENTLEYNVTDADGDINIVQYTLGTGYRNYILNVNITGIFKLNSSGILSSNRYGFILINWINGTQIRYVFPTNWKTTTIPQTYSGKSYLLNYVVDISQSVNQIKGSWSILT